jgi:hypothetical protein
MKAKTTMAMGKNLATVEQKTQALATEKQALTMKNLAAVRLLKTKASTAMRIQKAGRTTIEP